MKKGPLVAVAVAALILLVACIYVYSNRDRLMGMVIEKSFVAMGNSVIKNLPHGVSQDSVRAMINDVAGKIKTANVDKQELKNFVSAFKTGFHDQKLDSAEISRLLEGLKRLESK